MQEVDDKFYDRADEHIHLSNKQLGEITRGKVSASMMYATARFNAYVSATGWNSGQEMEDAKSEIVDFFVEQVFGQEVWEVGMIFIQRIFLNPGNECAINLIETGLWRLVWV